MIRVRQVRWDRQLPDAAVRRDQTFIFFDDHQAALRRAVDAARWGFRHVAFDDNYLPGASDNFALNVSDSQMSTRGNPSASLCREPCLLLHFS